MIGEGKFRADLGRVFRLLDDLDLGPYRNFKPSADARTTDLLRSSGAYADTYKGYLRLQAYDISLEDGSLLFFRRDIEGQTLLSYGYLESPFTGMSYRQFNDEYYGTDLEDDGSASQEYEEYQAQLPLRPHVLPIRYDWSPGLYREGAHPAAHLHVGFDTGMRLAVDALLTPLQFLLLIIRHFYVEKWEKKACLLDYVIREAGSISDEHVVPDYRKGMDLLELRLIGGVGASVISNSQPTSCR